MKLNVLAFALTAAILWGLGLLLATWWIILLSGGPLPDDVTFLGRMYYGYSLTPVGSVVGLAWGFVDGLICGAIFAWLYNVLAGKMTKAAAAA